MTSERATRSGRQVPLVSYLGLEPEPHLVASACVDCGTLFLSRRNGCAACGGREFVPQTLATEGSVVTFTVVNGGKGGRPSFISVVVDLDGGGRVKANLHGVEPDPSLVPLGARVQMMTEVVGVDDEGTEAIGFGFTLTGRT